MRKAYPEIESVRWKEIQAVLFDVDGTLYDQAAVRRGMVLRLLCHYAAHPLRFREVLGIYHFRRLREEKVFQAVPFEAQMAEAARRSGLKDVGRMQRVIRRWMFETPLSLIRRHRNEPLLAALHRLQAEGKRIVIYSDYAPEEKLSVLGVSADDIFYPGKGGLPEMKPSKKSMRLILNTLAVDPRRLIYFGDREEKDGDSARIAGVHFILIS